MGGGPTFSRGGGGRVQIPISIATHKIYDFPGGSGTPFSPLDPHMIPLNKISQYIFLLLLACYLALIIHSLCWTPYRNRKEGVTMALPESETVDHPQKRAEKIQNTDSHNKIKLSSNQLNYKGQFNHTTIQLRIQHKTPHKSEENQAMDKEESTIYSMRLPPSPSTSLVREYIISAFSLQVLLCLKFPVQTCRVHTAFPP